MSLRANISERGNPINIIMHFTIRPIVSMRLLHILRMFVMTLSYVGRLFIKLKIESGKWKIVSFFLFPLLKLGEGRVRFFIKAYQTFY